MFGHIATMNQEQQGQAMPLGLALIMFVALAGIVLFNTGQMTTEKSRVANTADAAVYSGLIWQARALNFQAYTNRAMVANQVSIAQMVSLSSWTNYGRITARNLDSTIGWIPPVKPFTTAAANIMGQVENVVTAVVEVAVPVLDSVLNLLSESQRAVYLASFAVTPEVVRSVVKANDSNYSVNTAYSFAGLSQNALAWKNFSQRYSDDESLQRKADVINNSKDKFTNNRDWNAGEILGIPGDDGRIYLTPINRVTILKKGTTKLIQTPSSIESDANWEWKGKDVLSLHVGNLKLRRARLKWKEREFPVGWGEAYVQDELECEDVGSGGWLSTLFGGVGCPSWSEMRENRFSEYLADVERTPLKSNYSGLQDYYDLKDLSRVNKDPRLLLSVEVEARGNKIRTSSNVEGIGSPSASSESQPGGFTSGLFRVDDKMASSSIASISSGEIYYKHPSKSTDVEYANLFNPYWDVRLSETSFERRMAAWAIRSPELVAGVANGAIDGVQYYANQQSHELEQLRELQQQTVAAIEDEVDSMERQQLQQTLASVQQQVQGLEQSVQQTQQMGQNVAQNIQQGFDQLQQYVPQNLDRQRLLSLQQEGAQMLASGVIDSLEDELKEGLMDALKNKLKNYAAQYGGEYYTMAEDIYASVDESVEEAKQFKEDIIDAPQEMLDELDEAVEQLVSEIEQEAEDTKAQLETEIDQLKSRLEQTADQEVLKLVQDELDALEQEQQQLEQTLQLKLQEEQMQLLEDLTKSPQGDPVQTGAKL